MALHPEERRAWVLNLDAEAELEAGRRYRPSRHLEGIVRARAGLLRELTAPGDVVLTEELLEREPDAARGLQGLAWSPTPRARALLERAGARVGEVPDLAVLQRVNGRPFTAELRARLWPEALEKRVVTAREELLALLARPADRGWLVRRTFGAAGRGRRRIHAGRPDAAELAWIEAGLRRGPLVVEPFVRVTREYTRSGQVDAAGGVRLWAPCHQTTDRHGAWTDSEPLAASEVREDDERLAQAAEEVGRALHAAGYHGPFGIDAFRHRTPEGGEALNVLSEINARFTMDWARALGPGLR